jgi:hypothetical protein
MSNENRKHFIDNIRWAVVVLVIVYHVAYIFNSAGVLTHVYQTGIPQFDIICYFVYPWLMPIMFLVAGISARFSLQKRDDRQFIRERAQKLLVPFFGAMFLFGWICGWVNNQYVDMFAGNNAPVIIKYIVYCFAGNGPLWFLLELFLVSMILLILRKMDKNERFCNLAGKSNFLVIILMALPFWGSSFLLNTPVVTVFRNGIYLFSFLTGYYILSHEETINILEKYRLLFLSAGVLLGITAVYVFYGKNFVDDKFLQHPLVNLYSWIMMLAITGCFKKYFNKTNRLTEYIKKRNFFWFICHYPIMVILAYVITEFLNLPFIFNYFLLLFSTLVLTIIFSEIIRLIPVLRVLVFGINFERSVTCPKKKRDE